MDWLLLASMLLVVDILLQVAFKPYLRTRDDSIELLSSLVLFLFCTVLMTIENVVLQLVLAGPLVGLFILEWARNYVLILFAERPVQHTQARASLCHSFHS